MVVEIEMDKRGYTTGVIFDHEGNRYRQAARVVILANFVVETPRLLLNGANSRWPQGLANSSGYVGKCIMPHSSHDVYARFDDEIRLYKGTPVLALTQDFYETDSRRGFARGYTLNAHGARPVGMAGAIAGKAGIWGRDLHNIMRDYNFYARITLVGEVLPDESNKITLSHEVDEYGIPRAESHFSYGENDNRLIAHAIDQCNQIFEAAGGKPALVVPDSAHLMGGCRMGTDPQASVVDADCCSHDIPNLYVCSAAVFPTSGGGNPTNTVMAIAARTADRLIKRLATGEDPRRRKEQPSLT